MLAGTRAVVDDDLLVNLGVIVVTVGVLRGENSEADDAKEDADADTRGDGASRLCGSPPDNGGAFDVGGSPGRRRGLCVDSRAGSHGSAIRRSGSPGWRPVATALGIARRALRIAAAL